MPLAPSRLIKIQPQLRTVMTCGLGDNASHVFRVKIASSEPVVAFKKAIKEEKKPMLDHVTADSLTLWKVSIPVDDRFKENVGKVELRHGEALSPVTRLSSVFVDRPEDGHLHVIVKSPRISESEPFAFDNFLTTDLFSTAA